MRMIDIFYTNCNLDAKLVAPTLPGFQGPKRCIQLFSFYLYLYLYLYLCLYL